MVEDLRKASAEVDLLREIYVKLGPYVKELEKLNEKLKQIINEKLVIQDKLQTSNSKLEYYATIDELTKIKNRRAGLIELEEMLKLSNESNNDLHY